MLRGGKQGGVESPEIFNAVLEWVLEPLVRNWLERGHGFRFDDDDGMLLTHLIWADNIFLLSLSIDQFHDMVAEITEVVESIHFRWKSSSLQFMLCGPLHDHTSSAPAVRAGEAACELVDSMIALGVFVNAVGDTKSSVDY